MPWNQVRLFGFLVSLLLISGCQSHGIEVEVSNQSGSDIKDVTLAFTGGSEILPLVRDGSTESMLIEPTGESSLTISFTDSAGNTISKQADIYLEPGYQGTISVTVRPADQIDVQSNVSVY